MASKVNRLSGLIRISWLETEPGPGEAGHDDESTARFKSIFSPAAVGRSEVALNLI